MERHRDGEASDLELRRLFSEAIGLQDPCKPRRLSSHPKRSGLNHHRLSLWKRVLPSGVRYSRSQSSRHSVGRVMAFRLLPVCDLLACPGNAGWYPKGCGMKWVVVFWGKKGAEFTLLFGVLIMTLVKEIPVAVVAKLIGEHDTKLWRDLHHEGGLGRGRSPPSEEGESGCDGKPPWPQLRDSVLQSGGEVASV